MSLCNRIVFDCRQFEPAASCQSCMNANSWAEAMVTFAWISELCMQAQQ